MSGLSIAAAVVAEAVIVAQQPCAAQVHTRL
jgi:hypothetical protein